MQPSDNNSTNTHLTGYAADVKGKQGLNRVIKAAGYSRDGFIAAYRHEAAFRQVTWLNGLLIIALILVPFSLVVKMLLLFASFFSVVVELFNTGIEAAIDHTSTERHPLAKIAKDVGSAAQFLALTLLVLLWMMAIFLHY